MILLFFKLLIGHFICDYSLQNDFVAKAKNHRNPIPGIPFWQVLAAHAAMHGGMVWYLTDSPICGAVEFILHAAIDAAKCEGLIGFNTDQALHALCKAVYVFRLI